MPEVFSGFIIGFGLALVTAPLAAVTIVRMAAHSPAFRRLAPPGTNLLALSVVLHLFGFLVFTAVGMVLGMILLAFEDRRSGGGLGSPNAAFTVLILAITAIAVLPLALAWPRARRPLLAGGLLFAGLFGWLMPYIAGWAPHSG